MKEYDALKGKTILGVREMTPREAADYGWEDCGSAVPMVMILSGGVALVPSQDPEGNGPGHLFVEKLTPVKKASGGVRQTVK